MGLPMAANLLDAGFTVRAWNRTAARAAPLAERGAYVAADPADAVAGADVVLTMLTDGAAVHAVMTDLPVAPGALWVQASTVGARYADEFAALADRLGVTYVDAPVMGTKQPAERGQLVVLASGPDDARVRCAPLFDAVGSRTVWVGPAGTGSRLKLAVNAWVTTLTGATAEALALAAGLGLDGAQFLDTIAGASVDSQYAHIKGAAMLAGEYPPSFPLAHAAKDGRLIRDAATDAGVDLPLSAAVLDRFEAAEVAGHGDEDMAAVYRVY